MKPLIDEGDIVLINGTGIVKDKSINYNVYYSTDNEIKVTADNLIGKVLERYPSTVCDVEIKGLSGIIFRFHLKSLMNIEDDNSHLDEIISYQEDLHKKLLLIKSYEERFISLKKESDINSKRSLRFKNLLRKKIETIKRLSYKGNLK